MTGSQPTTEDMPTPGQPPPGQPEWHAIGVDEVLAVHGVDTAQGLSNTEVAKWTQTFGPNKFAEGAKESRWHVFLRQYEDPMQIVLFVAGVICLFLPGQFLTGVLLLLLTLLNAWMGADQEGKAEESVAALQKMLVVKARVTRDGQLVEVAMDALVPGDIVNVEAGDLVLADARIKKLLHIRTSEVPAPALAPAVA